MKVSIEQVDGDRMVDITHMIALIVEINDRRYAITETGKKLVVRCVDRTMAVFPRAANTIWIKADDDY